jgi:hypothetical protein
MNGHRVRARLIRVLAIRALSAGVIVLVAVGVASTMMPHASAQSDPANNAGISLVNRSGEGAHLWLGHSGAPNAWVLPGESGYWFMTLRGERAASGSWNYDDKVRVNALRKGAPKEQTVTREFQIRGRATNMRAIWDGSTLQLAADYPAGEGPSGGSAGTGTTAGSTTGSSTTDDGDMGPWPLSAEETVEALTASIIAIIMGIIAGNLAAAGAAAAVGAPGGEAAAASASGGPMDSGLRDPDSGDAVAAWEPGKYTAESGGQAGDVWYDGRWQSRDVAAAQIQSTLSRRVDQGARNTQYEAEGRLRNQQLDEEAQARQRDADARARAERDQRNNDLGVAREEAKHEVAQTIRAGMDRNAAYAERMKQAADTADTGLTIAKTARTVADTSMTVVSNFTGDAGSPIKRTYTFATKFIDKVGEGSSAGEALKEGLTAVGVDEAKKYIVKATGLFKLPTAGKDQAVSEFVKTVTKVDAATLGAKWATGEVVKIPLKGTAKRLGLTK